MKAKTIFRMVWLTAAVSAGAAHAALGGDAASVEADRVAMKGEAVASVANELYAVRELQAATGTSVKEYLSPGGVVFAVSWSGPALPDLRQLLGAQFDVYTAAARARNAGPGHLDIREPGLVVQSAGQMRAFFGRAYIPALVPAGVALDQIR